MFFLLYDLENSRERGIAVSKQELHSQSETTKEDFMQDYGNRGERPGCSLKLTVLKQRAKWFLRTGMDDQGWGIRGKGGYRPPVFAN